MPVYLNGKKKLRGLRSQRQIGKSAGHCNDINVEDLVKDELGNEMLEPIVLTINPDDSSTI